MTTRRLLEESTDLALLELLRSAEEDTLPDGALERALVAVGVSSAVVLGTGTLASATSPGFAWSLVVRELFLSMVLGIGVTAAGVAVLSSLDPEEPARLTRSASPNPAALAGRTTAEGPTPSPRLAPAGLTSGEPPLSGAPRRPDLAPEPLDAARRTFSTTSPDEPNRSATDEASTAVGRASYPRSPPTAPGSLETSLLAHEIALVDAARAALAREEPAAALSIIERHEVEILHKSLGVEAALLRIDALLALGRRADARGVARRLLASGLAGPHASRLKQLVSQDR